jgi:VanZ family protein
MLFSPASALPKTGLFNIPHFDKIVHFGMFAMLIFLFRQESDRFAPAKQLIRNSFLFLALIFSAISEVIQYRFISGRTGSIKDFIADLIGFAAGTLFYIWIWKKLALKFEFLRKL